jgi:hypothetical protein
MEARQWLEVLVSTDSLRMRQIGDMLPLVILAVRVHFGTDGMEPA